MTLGKYDCWRLWENTSLPEIIPCASEFQNGPGSGYGLSSMWDTGGTALSHTLQDKGSISRTQDSSGRQFFQGKLVPRTE